MHPILYKVFMFADTLGVTAWIAIDLNYLHKFDALTESAIKVGVLISIYLTVFYKYKRSKKLKDKEDGEH